MLVWLTLWCACTGPALTNVCKLEPLSVKMAAATPGTSHGAMAACLDFRQVVAGRAVLLALSARPIEAQYDASAMVAQDFQRYQGVAVLVDASVRESGERCLEALIAAPQDLPSFEKRAVGFAALERFTPRVYYDPLLVLGKGLDPGPQAGAAATQALNEWRSQRAESGEAVVFLFGLSGFQPAPAAGRQSPDCPHAYACTSSCPDDYACAEVGYREASFEVLAVTQAGRVLAPVATAWSEAGYRHCQEELFSRTGWQYVRALANYVVVRTRFSEALLPPEGRGVRLIVRGRPVAAGAKPPEMSWRAACLAPGATETLGAMQQKGRVAEQFAPYYFGIPGDLSGFWLEPEKAAVAPRSP